MTRAACRTAALICAAAGLPLATSAQDLLIRNAKVHTVSERGTLDVGKNADVTLWSSSPFSVYTRVDKVWIDGALRYDRGRAEGNWRW